MRYGEKTSTFPCLKHTLFLARVELVESIFIGLSTDTPGYKACEHVGQDMKMKGKNSRTPARPGLKFVQCWH